MNKNTLGVIWVEINPPLRTQDGGFIEEPVALQWVKIICPGQKIKIRPHPNIIDDPIGMIKSGEIIEVYSKHINGFYQLANDNVSLYSYI